jgi:carbon storage regulator
MLLLTRKPGDAIVIDGRIVVKVIDVQGGRVQLGIEAPKDVKIEAADPAASTPGKGSSR